MKLAVKPRESGKKSELKQMRREGQIPAIIYSSKGKPEQLTLNAADFNAVLRATKQGQLPTTVFTLTDGNKERKAIVKDIQYHLTTYVVSHIDFEELVDDVTVCVKVPVNCTGVAECVGVKFGGFLRQVVRHVKVECLPKHIPSDFQIDVRDLGIRQSKRLKHLALPTGVRALASPEEVLVVIAKR
ncbi:MAG: 50S ribosomal protein L25 [Verrucomicrobia bacterium]|nr:50S ribosomal protein L25 [Verrucomicrobiota bacterium]